MALGRCASSCQIAFTASSVKAAGVVVLVTGCASSNYWPNCPRGDLKNMKDYVVEQRWKTFQLVSKICRRGRSSSRWTWSVSVEETIYHRIIWRKRAALTSMKQSSVLEGIMVVILEPSRTTVLEPSTTTRTTQDPPRIT